VLSHFSFRKYLAFISTLEIMIREMGKIIEDYLPYLCKILHSIYQLSTLFLTASKGEISLENEEIPEDGQKSYQKLKRKTLKMCYLTNNNVHQICNKLFHKYFYSSYICTSFATEFIKINELNISKFSTQNITAPSNLLDIFVSWSKHKEYHSLFLKCTIIDQFCKVLASDRNNVAGEVYNSIFIILKNIVLYATDQEDLERRDYVIHLYANNYSDDEQDEKDKPKETQFSNKHAIEIIQAKIVMLCDAIYHYLENHFDIIKSGIFEKRKEIGKRQGEINNLIKRNKSLKKEKILKSK
jgi:hypothetical protein